MSQIFEKDLGELTNPVVLELFNRVKQELSRRNNAGFPLPPDTFLSFHPPCARFPEDRHVVKWVTTGYQNVYIDPLDEAESRAMGHWECTKCNGARSTDGIRYKIEPWE